MADTPTPLDITNGPPIAEILPSQSTQAATVVSDSDMEIEDVGRVRGDFDSVVKAERAAAAVADGSDPSVLGEPDRPEQDISDDTDAGHVAHAMDPDRHEATPKGKAKAKGAEAAAGESGGKLRLSKRVAKLQERVAGETRTYRELQQGNIELARRLLAEAEGRPAETGARAPAARPDTRPRRPDGTFAKAEADPEPMVPEKPARPKWEEYEAQDKSWAEYNRDLAAWDEKREAYLEAKSAHDAWVVRRDLTGQIGERDRRMAEMTQQTQRERAEAAFDARRSVVRQQIGEQRWKEIHGNWAEFDKAGYESDAMETLFKLHAKGPHLMAALGEQIEKAAALAEHEWTMPMFDGIMSLEDPTAVLLALADDPEEFERIASLPASRAVAAIGALSGRLEAGSRVHGSRPATAVSKAPAPIRPVGGRREGGATRSGNAAFSEDADIVDYVRDTNEAVRGRS